jgi:hypothetical protein
MSQPQTIMALARRIGRLSPDWRNPERYFENRSEIERDLRRLAKQLETSI